MSPRLNLIDVSDKPKSASRVNAKCTKCGAIQNIVLSELVRTVNRQSRHVDTYHCAKCFRTVDSYRLEAKETSKAALAGRTEELSARAKEALARPEVRAKILEHTKKLSISEEFKKKVSVAIKNKFDTDEEYVKRVNAGRCNKPAEFLSKCAEVHDGLYDYSNTIYKGTDILFDISCPLHGVFTQLPSNHIRGHGCPTCALEKSRLSAEEYFKRCSIVHDNKYSYDNSVYTSSLEYIEYTCPSHGLIRQLAQNHLKGSGCRFCDANKTSSRGEDELASFIGSIKQCERNNRIVLGGEEIDILAGNIGIEYHGIYWHSFNRQETTEEKYKHYNKTQKAIDAGVQLIQIYETEWLQHNDIVKSMLRAKLGVIINKIQARKCTVTNMSESEAHDFFRLNHLQGHRRSEIYHALRLDGKIVAAASFNRSGDGWELMRFCNALDTIVIGGLSKIMKNSRLEKIFTYADRRYSDAKSYMSVGFKLLGVTTPGYKYCKSLKLFPRQMFQKHKLKDLLKDFDPNRTESENMFANGYRRIWDAGHWRLELN